MPERPFKGSRAVGGSGFAARNREIVDLRVQGLTLAEIGERFGLTRQRVAQIVNAAGAGAQAISAGRTDVESAPLASGPGGQSTSARRACVRRLLERGLSPSQIAARLDSHVYTVYGDLAWLRAVDGRHRCRG